MRVGRDVIHPLVKTRSFLTNAFIKNYLIALHILLNLDGSFEIRNHGLCFI